MCRFVNAGVVGLWQVTQSAGTSSFSSEADFVDAWGVWQDMHPFSTGGCLNFAFFVASPRAE
jgi:hypothetical protein